MIRQSAIVAILLVLHVARADDAKKGELVPRTVFKADAVDNLGNLAYSPDGSRLVVSGHRMAVNKDDNDGGTWLVVLNAATGKEEAKFKLDAAKGKKEPKFQSDLIPLRETFTLQFTPDGKTIAIGDSDEAILWEPASGASRRVTHSKGISDGHHPAGRFAISPNSQVIALGGRTGPIELWDLRAQKLLRSAVAGGHTAAFSPDGKVLISRGRIAKIDPQRPGAVGRGLHLHDAETGAHLAELNSFDGHSVEMAFASNGQSIALDAQGGAVIWKIAKHNDKWTAARAAVVRGHSGRVGAIAFSPDTSMLMTVSNGTIRLWDAATGRASAALIHNLSQDNMAAFSPDGKHLAIANWGFPGLNNQVAIVDLAAALDPQRVAAQAKADFEATVKYVKQERGKVDPDDAPPRFPHSLNGFGPDADTIAPLVMAGMRDPNPKVRQVCAIAAGKMRDAAKTLVPALREAMNDQDASVRSSAKDALEAIAPAEVKK